MASLVDFYKQKLAPVGQRLSSFIDRDKSMEGIQLAQGGLINQLTSRGIIGVGATPSLAPVQVRPAQQFMSGALKPVADAVGTFGKLSFDAIVKQPARTRQMQLDTQKAIDASNRALQTAKLTRETGRPDLAAQMTRSMIPQLQSESQRFTDMGNEAQAKQKSLVGSGVRTGLYASALLNPVASLGAGALSTGLGAAFAGQTSPEQLGTSFGEGVKYGGMPNPAIKGGLLTRSAGGGLINLAEDYLYAKTVENRNLTPKEIALSLALPATFETFGALRKAVKAKQKVDVTTTSEGLTYNKKGQLFDPITGQFAKSTEESRIAVQHVKDFIAAGGKPVRSQTRLIETAPNKWIDEQDLQTFDSTIDTPKLSVEPAGKLQELETASKELGQAMNDTSKVDSVYQKYIGGKATNFTSKLDAIRNKMVTTNNDLYSARYAASKPLSVEPTIPKDIQEIINARNATKSQVAPWETSINRNRGEIVKTFYGDMPVQKAIDEIKIAESDFERIGRETGKFPVGTLDIINRYREPLGLPKIVKSGGAYESGSIQKPRTVIKGTPSGRIQEQNIVGRNAPEGKVDLLSSTPSKPLSVEPVGGKVNVSDLTTKVLKNEDIVRSLMNGEVFKMQLDNGRVVAFGDKAMLARLSGGLGDDVTDIIPAKVGRGKTGEAGSGIPRLILESQDDLIKLKHAISGKSSQPPQVWDHVPQGAKINEDGRSFTWKEKQYPLKTTEPQLRGSVSRNEVTSTPNYTPSPLGGKVGEVISTTKPLSVEPVGGEVKTVTPIRKPLKEVYLNKLNQPAELPKVPESLTTTTGLSKVSPTIQSTQRSLREPSQPLSSQDQLKSLTRVTPISSKNVASPDILPSTVKSRGLTESVQQAQNIVPEVKSGVTGTYTPKPNAQLMAEAQTLLNEGGTVDLSKVKNADQKVAATIQEAINAQQAGDHQLAANLFNNLSEQGTELGRGVQAFSLLEKMSPEAVSLSAAGQIKKYNATHSAKLPELTGDQSKLIADKVANIRTMPDGRDKNIALNEVNQIINSFIPSSLADKAITIWKAGLLTSLRTHLRNQIGNSVHTGMEIAKDVLATPIDVMLSGATGQRTKTLTVKGMGEFGSQSTRQQIMDIMSKGFDPTQQINKFDHRQVNWGNNPVEKVLKVYTDLVFRSLGAADKPYYNSVLARSLYDQAGASAINAGRRGDIGFINDLVKNPTDGMLKIAINDANVATFKDKNTYSKVANAIKQSMVQAGQEYGGDFGRESSKILTEFVAPFTGVPSSIAGQIVAYSPVGLVKGIAKAGKVIVNKIPDLQRQAVEEIGRGGIGTAVMALGAYLASKGMVTGQPKDAAEQRQWDLENKPRNSIFINGKWRSLNSIGPEALVFLAGAKADEEMNNPEGSLSKYAGTLIKDQLDQSFVQGIQGPVNAITDPQRYAKSYIGNSVSSFVPNIIKDVSKSIDPYARETNTTGDYVKASIPGLRNTLVNKRDTLGRVINQEPTGAAAFVDVFNSKTPVSNPVVQEFSRLNDSGFNVAPGKIGKAQTINGQKVNLNPQELDQFEQKVGQVAMPSLQQLISSPSYQSSDDENKSKQIDSLMTKIRAQVRSGNLETVTQTVKKIVTKKVKKVSSKKPKTVKKISAPKLSKFNLASKVRKVKRIRTKQYKLQIPK